MVRMFSRYLPYYFLCYGVGLTFVLDHMQTLIAELSRHVIDTADFVADVIFVSSKVLVH